ncbi:ABC transporter permease subunit [uncultured Nitrospira sp.]|uniref:ABC transporter permease n=1 Tax=uncultured Nitrospira sp. TaxID=157176 RepID=UPI0031406F1B
MNPVHTIVAKELRSAFVSPVVYVIAAIFLAIVGLLAYSAAANASNQAIRLMQIQNTYAQLNLNDMLFRPLFRSINLILMIILPLLTMRLFAEERKLRTFELLLTSPIGVNEIVSGKFMSVIIVYSGLLSLTSLIPITLSAYATFDWRPIYLGYVALFLQGTLLISIGLFASALTENQIIAAFLSFGCILGLWMLGALGGIVGDTTIGHILSYLSFSEHYERLIRGLFNLKDILYYVSGIAFMWFAAHQAVDAYRWK